MKDNRKYKCRLCDEIYPTLEDVVLHVDEYHQDIIPDGWTALQVYYKMKTHKTHGNCIMCKAETDWNQSTNKYHRFCTNVKCKEKYVEIFKSRMIGKHGKTTLLNDPEQQKKMLANRKISGVYKWNSGGSTSYTGTYELEFLRVLDIMFDFVSTDIIAPSPHTYYYLHDGRERFYIPDFFIPSLSLEIEIKDGGTNPNMHHKILDVDKKKEQIKDSVLLSQKDFSYIKVIDKKYDNMFQFLLESKVNFADGKEDKRIFIL